MRFEDDIRVWKEIAEVSRGLADEDYNCLTDFLLEVANHSERIVLSINRVKELVDRSLKKHASTLYH